jgi:hypothetical protein
MEIRDQLRGHCIEFFGSIEGDSDDPFIGLIDEQRGHALSPFGQILPRYDPQT